MAHYQFALRCSPVPRTRAREIESFFALTSAEFRIPSWINENDKQFSAEPDSLRNALAPLMAASTGQRHVVSGGKSSTSPPILVLITLGGDRWTYNGFRVDYSEAEITPGIAYFKDCIEAIRPFEAIVFDQDHLDELKALVESGARRTRQPQPEDPNWLQYWTQAIHWIHYLDSNLIREVGGFEHALRTPCFSVTRFCDGLLFQLTEEVFDNTNDQHCQIQRQAMEHLGIW
jgi:hypothetical protein